MNKLPNSFYVYPNLATTTMSSEDLKETLLSTDGTIIAHGRLREIRSESLGVGVYRVSLKPLKD